jgi:hypothetical protein
MTLAVIFLFILGVVPAGAAADGEMTTQQPGLLRIPTQSTPWLLGSVSGLEKLKVSHSVSFGYSSGGALDGPSGDYLTHLAYPLHPNLQLKMSLGVDWNPAFAEAFGEKPTEFGIRDLQLNWHPNRSTHISIGYSSYRGYQPWGYRPAYGLLGNNPGMRPWWGESDVDRESEDTAQ